MPCVVFTALQCFLQCKQPPQTPPSALHRHSHIFSHFPFPHFSFFCIVYLLYCGYFCCFFVFLFFFLLFCTPAAGVCCCLCAGKLVEFGKEPGRKKGCVEEAVESFCLTLSGISLDHMRHATAATSAKAASTRTTDNWQDTLVLLALKGPSLSLLLQHLIRLNVKSANSFSCCNPDFFMAKMVKGGGVAGEKPTTGSRKNNIFPRGGCE